jgi:hypothetical protein
LGGLALFLLAGLLLAATTFGPTRRLAWRREVDPAHTLRVFTVLAGGGVSKLVFDVTGTLTGEPDLTGPITGRPCSAWQITLLRRKDSQLVSQWSAGHNGVLTLAFEERLVGGRARDARPGRFTIAPGMVDVAQPTREEMPLPHPVDVPVASLDLPSLGVPAEIAQAATADPDAYVMRERMASTGDFFRVRQGPFPVLRSVPDPAVRYTYLSGPQEYSVMRAGFLLVVAAVVVAVVAAGLGLDLLRQ